MPPVTCVRPEDIRELNQHQLTRLLKTLLSCEARRFGIPLSGAEVRTQITVPDGGEDGHIRWEGGPEKTDWFPRRFTVFQLKAKKMGPAACGAEVLGREGTLKPRVAEALAQEGAYVQVFNKNCAQDRAKNVRAVRKAVRKARGVCGASAEVDVYDLEKLTDWTNGHIPAVIQVLEERGLTAADPHRSFRNSSLSSNRPRSGTPRTLWSARSAPILGNPAANSQILLTSASQRPGYEWVTSSLTTSPNMAGESVIALTPLMPNDPWGSESMVTRLN